MIRGVVFIPNNSSFASNLAEGHCSILVLERCNCFSVFPLPDTFSFPFDFFLVAVLYMHNIDRAGKFVTIFMF